MYLVIVPVKESVLYDRLGKGVPGDTREYDRWVKKLARKSGVNIIYPKEKLIQKAKTAEDLIFFKQDHHYTEYGFFFIYRELMKQIKRDFPDIPVLSEKIFPFLMMTACATGTICANGRNYPICVQR